MSDPVTVEDIYALFKASHTELKASSEEFDRRLQESDRRAEEAKRENERNFSKYGDFKSRYCYGN